METQKYTLAEAKERLEKYCGNQERSMAQIRRNLYQWGIYGDTTE